MKIVSMIDGVAPLRWSGIWVLLLKTVKSCHPIWGNVDLLATCMNIFFRGSAYFLTTLQRSYSSSGSFTNLSQCQSNRSLSIAYSDVTPFSSSIQSQKTLLALSKVLTFIFVLAALAKCGISSIRFGTTILWVKYDSSTVCCCWLISGTRTEKSCLPGLIKPAYTYTWLRSSYSLSSKSSSIYTISSGLIMNKLGY